MELFDRRQAGLRGYAKRYSSTHELLLRSQADQMSIYFAFSDECGTYQQFRTESFRRAFPYYLRATFFMLASEYKSLSAQFHTLKESFDLPTDKEIKWAYLWELRHYQTRNIPVPATKPYHFLEPINHHTLIDFCEASLGLLTQLTEVKTILTLTDNRTCRAINERDFHKMHLQELMQRVEMDLQTNAENLAVIFLDPVSNARNKQLRDAYFDLFIGGDFIRQYCHIKDSLNFEDSIHSTGVQLADYLAGVSVGFFKGYNRSKSIFCGKVKPLLRKSSTGTIEGYGIREVPRDFFVRRRIIEGLSTC